MGGHRLIQASRPGPPRWLRLLGPLCSEAVLVVLCTLGVWALAVPVITGLRPVAITSASMAPSLRPGDVVLLDADAEPSAGRVATFRAPATAGGELVTHRLASHGDGGWRTRGDANGGIDPWVVPDTEVLGVGRMVVPFVALPVVWVHQGRIELLAVTALGFAALLWSAGTLRRRGGRHLRMTVAVRLERAGRVLLRTSVILALVFASAAQTPATGAFTGATDNGTSSVGAATVPPPTNLVATASCQLLIAAPKIDLSWDAASGATGYEVYRDDGTGLSLLTTLIGTTYSDTTVAGLTTYTYVVRTQWDTWTSVDSNTASDSTGVCL